MAKPKKQNTWLSDEALADLLRQAMSQGWDKSLYGLSELLSCKFGQLRRVIKSLPAEFGLYKLKGAEYVKSYATSAQNQRRRRRGGDASGEFHCGVCREYYATAENLEQHKRTARHKVNLLDQQLKSSGSFHANLQGLQVSEFEQVAGLKLNQRKVLELVVENVGNVSHELKAAYQVRNMPDVKVLTDFGANGVQIPPGSQFMVEVEVKPSSYGIVCTLLMLDFGFVIARELRVECDPFGGDSSMPDISSKGPYQKRKVRNLLPVNPPNFVPGKKEKRPKMPWLRPPRQHDVPTRLRLLVSGGHTDELQAELDKFKTGPADLRNHLDKLHMLLHLEELQQEIDVRSYDMKGVELLSNSAGRYLTLKVPGLAEARPSVLRGDALYVSRADGSGGGKEWQGFVHIVRQEEVSLCFNTQFHRSFIRGTKYNVRFSIKRTSFVFMHEALDVAKGGAAAGLRKELLVPSPTASSIVGNPIHISCWRNGNVGNNPEQAKAVRCIVAGTSGQLPFIIWGPPGTGKTSTLVEAATQVLALQPSSKLLLVAPSNLAADLLALRLLQSGRPKSEMLRVCAFSRPYDDLLPGLSEVVLYHNDAFQLPSLQQLTANRLRVVVVTALMAAKLHALGVPGGHFTHIMFDEAGQAEEPLALCAMAGLAGPSTQVVLAGDPKQLGPVIHSGAAKQAGLGLSLLERLTSMPPYAAVVEGDAGSSGGGSSSSADGLIVKLVRNYRSHPKLLELPSQLFYQADLKACAGPEITNTLLHWDKLPNKTFPMIFHSIVGKDEQELQSPSWFNVQEAKLVLHYIEALRSIRRLTQVTADQIAVVTPYRRQVQRIKTLLTAKGFGSVQVGSVEQLQGQEKRVVIISTVRSTPNYLSHDLKHKLGFVGNAKRFNVAITRAQALMIVIGNPAVLMHDRHWLALLMHCQAHNACVGQPMPDLSEAAAAAAAGAGEHANSHMPGAAGTSNGSSYGSYAYGQAGSSSSSNGHTASSSRDGVSSSLQQQIVQLEKLMASITLSKAVDDAAAQHLLLQETLGFSGLVDEAGGGMVRRE